MVYYDNRQFDTEIKYEIYLLKKYLTKHYDEQTAIALLKNNSSDLDKLAKALGEIDITFFCLYFMSDTFVVKDDNAARELSKAHYELWKVADDIFLEDKYDKAAIIEPRGFAKTTIFDMAVTTWLHCYKKSLFTLIGAKTDSDASQFLDSIKKVFKENKKVINSFGKLINPKEFTVNANEVELSNGTYIRTVGSGTSVRGANWGGIRPTVFIGDDFQDEKNILTDMARDKQYNKWTKEIEQVGDKAVYRNGKKVKQATKVIAIGTVLHMDCLMSKLSRNNDYYTILERAIILEPGQIVDDIFESELWVKCKHIYFDDKLEKDQRKEKAKQFYEENKTEMSFPTLWEEKWDCFNDLAIPYWENRMSFMSELMNDATSIGEKWFKSVRTQSREEIEEHEFIKTMLCVDPASTTNKKSDYTAMVVGSEADNGFNYMRELILCKFEFNNYCKKVVEVLEEYEDIVYIYIEKNTFQGADIIKIKELISKSEKLRSRSFEWINEMQKKNKDEKISTVIDPINNGQVIFVDDNKDFIDQVLEFQGQLYTLHDDAADIVAECVNRLKAIEDIGIVQILDRKAFGL